MWRLSAGSSESAVDRGSQAQPLWPHFLTCLNSLRERISREAGMLLSGPASERSIQCHNQPHLDGYKQVMDHVNSRSGKSNSASGHHIIEEHVLEASMAILFEKLSLYSEHLISSHHTGNEHMGSWGSQHRTFPRIWFSCETGVKSPSFLEIFFSL